MTAPIPPGTSVTVVLSGEYDEQSDTSGGHYVDLSGKGYSTLLPADALIVPASDGADPATLTPALRSLAHRAARDAGEAAPLNTAVEAAVSALEPVVAGLIARARDEERRVCAAEVRRQDEESGNVGVDSVWTRLAERWEEK